MNKEEESVDAVLKKDDSFSKFLEESMATGAVAADSEATKSSKVVIEKKQKRATAMKNAKKQPSMRGELLGNIEGVDENLGEDFEQTPWVPPSIELAEEFKKGAIYHGGDARIDALSLVNSPDLGAGTSLYFQFAMTMAITLFFMSFFSLPALIYIYNGTGIREEDKDTFGLYKYTLGNIGAVDYSLSGSRCTQDVYAYNDTCIHYGDSEISITDAANVMSAMEFIQIAIFFVGILYLHRRAFSITGSSSKGQVKISDFTVQVRNIPPDTKDFQILQHFSELYALDKKDWQGRPPVLGVKNVDDIGNTKNQMHMNTWVAECTLHKGIGGFISTFKDKQYLMDKLYRARANMKMYAENSPHLGGHRLGRYRSAEKAMLKTGAKIDDLTQKTIKRNKLKIILNADQDSSANRPGTAGGGAAGGGGVTSTHMISNPKSIYRNIDAPAVSVYITFQYSESRARCLEDYEKYEHYPYSLFYPGKLMFRGKKILVSPAPEPDQIVWENLEVGRLAKFYKRTRTSIITVLLVVVCFIVILQASIYKNLFSGNIPSDELCDEVVPLLYLNGTSNVRVDRMVLTRPVADERASKDATCENTLGETAFYATYTIDGDPAQEVGSYDYSACTQYGLCPSDTRATQCPCLSTKNEEACLPAGCSIGDTSSACEAFEASILGVCYCYSALNNILSSNGVATTLDKLQDQREDESCQSFYREYSLSVGLTYLSVATSAIANTLLRTYLKVLAKQEAHTNSDDLEGSIMVKTFQSSYAIMAIIVLIAYGRSSNTPQILKDLRIFVGPYDDFTRSWYGNIGFYLMTTFIIGSYSPLAFNLVMYFVGKPLLRYYHHDKVRKLQSTSIVMQNDLNKLEVGPIFDSTTHTAQLLTLLFFAMTFAPGLPLMMPLCCFTFIMYFRIDKMLLCRFYQRPPQLGDSAIRVVISLLPYAAIIRLAFACWMFSNKDIIPESTVDGTESSSLSSVREQGGEDGVQARLFRDNVIPLWVLMLVIFAFKVVMQLFQYIPIYWLLKCIYIVFHESLKKSNERRFVVDENGNVHPWDLMKMKDPFRMHSAPFCGTFKQYLKHKDEIPDTCLSMFQYAALTEINEADIEDGWETRNEKDYVMKVKVFKRVKKKSGHKRGDLKKTYEVIADHRCATYNIERIPAYVVPMQGLREGASSMMEAQVAAMREKNAVDAVLYDPFEGIGVGNLESNILQNYEKRKRGESTGPSPVNRTVSAHGSSWDDDDDDDWEEDEGEDTRGGGGGGEYDEYGGDVEMAATTKPNSMGGRTIPKKNAVAPAAKNDSFYAPPSPKKSDRPSYLDYEADASALAEEGDPYGAEASSSTHKPYMPKRRDQSADGDSSVHKPYMPKRRDQSADSSGGTTPKKKKKDKKHKKDRDYDYEAPPPSDDYGYGGEAPPPDYEYEYGAPPPDDPYSSDPYAEYGGYGEV